VMTVCVMTVCDDCVWLWFKGMYGNAVHEP